MQVIVGDKIVDVELVKQNAKTIWVRLPDGNVIKRHKQKHEVQRDEQSQIPILN